MRTVGLFLATLLLLAAVSAGSALAAPGITLSTNPTRRFVTVGFSDLKSVTRVSYTLTYDSGARQTGFSGGFRNPSKLVRTTRRQILGTCSAGRCVYHRSPKNLQVQATFTLRSGVTVKASKALK